MLSTAMKISTLRRALARGFVRMAPETVARIRANDLPKKDVLAVARAAGLLATKRTPDLIPHCHPLSLDGVELRLELMEEGVEIQCEVLAVAKTGVEMEALTGVSVAALTIYDLCKAVDLHQEIQAIALVEKEGGKSDFDPVLKPGFRAGVVVTSDRCSQGKAQDKTGPFLVQTLKGFGIQEVSYNLLPDEPEQIQALIRDLCGREVDLILTTGGTGLGPRDKTVEAVRPLLDRELPGAMEAARAFGQERTPYAMLSRGLAGQIGNTLIVTLPGSSAGVRESMAALYPYLFHAHVIMGSKAHA